MAQDKEIKLPETLTLAPLIYGPGPHKADHHKGRDGLVDIYDKNGELRDTVTTADWAVVRTWVADPEGQELWEDKVGQATNAKNRAKAEAAKAEGDKEEAEAP